MNWSCPGFDSPAERPESIPEEGLESHGAESQADEVEDEGQRRQGSPDRGAIPLGSQDA